MEDTNTTKAEDVIEDFFSQFDETVKATEGLAGKGIYGKVVVGYGYGGFFIQDVEPENCWFKYKPTLDKEDPERKSAQEAAKKFAAEHSIDKKIITRFRIVVLKDHTQGGKHYEKDLWSTFPTFTEGYKSVIVPSMRKCEMTEAIKNGQVEFWVHLKYTKDPSGWTKTVKVRGEDGEYKKDANGDVVTEEQVGLIPYFDAVYKDEAECKAAAIAAGGEEQSVVGDSKSSEYPAGWNDETWAMIIPDIKKEKLAGKSPAEISSGYNIPLPYVMKALNSK